MIREDCIQEMRNANTDRLQQISGQIIAIDDALDLGNWETIRIRWNEMLQ